MSLFSFNKSDFRSNKEIEKQYVIKIDLLLDNRKLENLSPREKTILKLLEGAKTFDPRYKNTCFGLKKQAVKAFHIAKNLDSMSDQEFRISSYPYEWLYEIDRKTICRVVNKEVVEIIAKIHTL